METNKIYNNDIAIHFGTNHNGESNFYMQYNYDKDTTHQLYRIVFTNGYPHCYYSNDKGSSWVDAYTRWIPGTVITQDNHQISFNWSTRGIYIDGTKVGSF